jgi:CMP-N-acetylneuraminic acid synthetase
MIYYVIPARKGSKGLPGKNRTLFLKTFDIFPHDVYSNVIVTTDDEEIKRQIACYRKTLSAFRSTGVSCVIHDRKPEHATDEASMRAVLLDIREEHKMKADDIIVLLYLTYPERTYQLVKDTLEYFIAINGNSLLCAIPAKDSPCQMVYIDGAPVVENNLYRRQDYPVVYVRSHCVAIMRAGELDHLSENLYNDDTIYFPIDPIVDVDTEEDLKAYENSSYNNA